MKMPSVREGVVVAIIVLLWGAVVASLVVLDKSNHTWLALLVYASVYVAIAFVEKRNRGQ